MLSLESMGSSWSSTFSTVGSLEAKNIINTILKRLITEVDMRDMYSLADPRACKEYIVVATSALTKLFASIRLSKDKDGTFLFQKIKGIQDKNPDPAMQQQRCKELAFFFIRIFQVYAAIALSIMDSELPATDPIEILRPSERRRGVVFINPQDGFKGFPQKKTGFSGILGGIFGAQRGGRLLPERDGAEGGNFYLPPDTVGPYSILNQYLVVPSDRGTGDLSFKTSETGTTYPLVVTHDSLYTFDGSNTRTVKGFAADTSLMPHVRCQIRRGEENIIVAADMKIEKTYEGTLDVTLRDVSFKDKRGGQLRRTFTVFGNTISSNGLDFLPALVAMFKQAADTLDPPPFSAAEFLREKGLLRTMDGVVPIEGTNLYVINPGGQKSETLKVFYRVNHKVDDRSQRIEISTDLVIEKRQKTVLEAQRYFVKVNFNVIETKPDFLKSELRLGTSQPRDDEDTRFRGKERYFSDSSRPVTDKGETIPIFLETVFKNMLVGKDELEERNGIRYTREGLPEPLNSDQIPPEMRIKDIWKALAKDPPVKAHCVARAMQLLNVAAIRGNETREAFSSICRVKFPYAKDGSLPPAGSSATEEYGILSLAMLFVDKLVAGSPQITESDRYTEFRKKFKFFFERYEQGALEQIQAPAKLADVKEKIMPGICEGHTKDRINLEGGIVYELQAKAKALLDRQATHLRNSMTILFKLFNEQAVRANRFEISAFVEQNGMEGVNQVAEEARNMLMEYYGDCEQTYKDGLFILYNKYQADPDSIRYTTVDTATGRKSDDELASERERNRAV